MAITEDRVEHLVERIKHLNCTPSEALTTVLHNVECIYALPAFELAFDRKLTAWDIDPEFIQVVIFNQATAVAVWACKHPYH